MPLRFEDHTYCVIVHVTQSNITQRKFTLKLLGYYRHLPR